MTGISNSSNTANEIYFNFNLAKSPAKTVILSKIEKTYGEFQAEIEQKEMVQQRISFVESNAFDCFFENLAKAVASFTEEDLLSITQGRPSETACHLMQSIKALDENGFSSVRGRSINFWSGQAAKERAMKDASLSDSQIPAIAMLFDICREVQKIEAAQKKMLVARFLPKVISALYSSEATDRVHVFISSNKLSERASLTIGNNFWESELPVLQSLYHQGKLKEILIYLHDGDDQWSPPVDLNSDQGNGLAVVRRRAHLSGDQRLDDDEAHRFVQNERWQGNAHFADWCKYSAARPCINLGRLKVVANKWRKLASQTR